MLAAASQMVGRVDAEQLRAALQRCRDRRVAAGLLRWMPGKSRDEE
jgi:hypothetical protein